MKILITGGLGFVGSQLSNHYYKNEHDVTIITKSLDKISNIRNCPKIKILKKDIRLIDDDCKGYDLIFHLASTVHNYHILDDPYIDVDINCNGTIRLLESCRQFNPSVRMIYVSSFFVNNGKPKALYGATKLCAEYICKIYNKVFGLNISIARLSNVFGPGEQKNNNKKAAFNRMIQLAIEDKEIKLYNNGNIDRDYIYIDDVVSALEIIADKGEESEVYEVGKGKSLNFKYMVDTIIKESGSGKIVSIEPPEFHKQVGIDDYYCNVDKLKDLGWEPKYTVEEGIRKTIEAYRNE